VPAVSSVVTMLYAALTTALAQIFSPPCAKVETERQHAPSYILSTATVRISAVLILLQSAVLPDVVQVVTIVDLLVLASRAKETRS